VGIESIHCAGSAGSRNRRGRVKGGNLKKTGNVGFFLSWLFEEKRIFQGRQVPCHHSGDG